MLGLLRIEGLGVGDFGVSDFGVSDFGVSDFGVSDFDIGALKKNSDIEKPDISYHDIRKPHAVAWGSPFLSWDLLGQIPNA